MKQKELGILGEVRSVELVPDALIDICADMNQAIQLCVQLSRMKRYAIADQLAMDHGNFSKVMGGQGNLSPNRIARLEDVCGNAAPLQYHAKIRGFELVPIKNSGRIAELEAELMRLRA